MSEERLRELFEELVEPVAAPQMAGRAWRRSWEIRRRRRRAGVGGALAVAAVVAGVMVAPGEDEPMESASRPVELVSPSASSVESDGVTVDLAPVPGDELRLPRVGTLLPEQVVIDPRKAVPLSGAPVRRALALFQVTDEESYAGPVYALGDDLRLRVMDKVSLQPVRDEGGNTQAALDDTALSREGTRAAFAQKDKVVIRDLDKDETVTEPVPGLNEDVRWRPNGLVTVAQAKGGLLLEPSQAAPVKLPYSVFDVVAETDSADLDVLVHRVPSKGPSVLETRTLRGMVLASKPVTSGSMEMADWYGTAWRNGGLVARSGTGPSEEHVAIINAATGKVIRALRFPGGWTDRFKNCCPVRGWLGEDSVLMSSTGPRGNRLLAWNIRSGAVSLVTELPATTRIALGDIAR